MSFTKSDIGLTQREYEQYSMRVVSHRQYGGEVSDQYNSMGLFNGYFNDDENIADTIDSLEDSFVDFMNKYPNLADNLKCIDSIYVLNNKQNIDKTNLSESTKEMGGTSDYAGFYNVNSDSIVLKEVFGDFGEMEKFNLAHEIGHSLDYADLDGNGQVDPYEVFESNFGNFSGTDTYKQAYLEDLKNIATKKDSLFFGITNSAELLLQKDVIDYATQGADFSDGIDEKDITSLGLEENLAVMTSYNLKTYFGGRDLIKKLFPNCYALTEEHLKTA